MKIGLEKLGLIPPFIIGIDLSKYGKLLNKLIITS
jgi:hypothetical protein